jgi:hypothetical protein
VKNMGALGNWRMIRRVQSDLAVAS